jgi:hypothetical protein
VTIGQIQAIALDHDGYAVTFPVSQLSQLAGGSTTASNAPPRQQSASPEPEARQ